MINSACRNYKSTKKEHKSAYKVFHNKFIILLNRKTKQEKWYSKYTIFQEIKTPNRIEWAFIEFYAGLYQFKYFKIQSPNELPNLIIEAES